MGDSLFTMQEKKIKKLANTNKSHTNANKWYQHRNKTRQYSKKYMSLSKQLHLVLLVFGKIEFEQIFLKKFLVWFSSNRKSSGNNCGSEFSDFDSKAEFEEALWRSCE